MTLRALFIVFELPPLAAGGVFRSLAMMEQLPSFGIELDVVSVRPDDYLDWSSSPFDDGLMARLPSHVRLTRVPSGFPRWYWKLARSRAGFRLLQYGHWGDPVSLFWRRPLFEALDRLVAERRPDVMLATFPPFGVSVLARVAARRYRLPWVADWRDPWTMWRTGPLPTYAHYRYVQTMEEGALREANVSVATSHVTRTDWLRQFPAVDPNRLVTVYNGYDRAELAAIPDPPAGPPEARTIAYVGTFYYDPAANKGLLSKFWQRAPHRWLFYTPRREDWLYASPYFFLRGLRRFADRHPELASRLTVQFGGTVPHWLPGMLRETGTESMVQLLGRLSHRESLRVQKWADAVLLPSSRVLGGPDNRIAGRMFEYFGLRRPVLGLLSEGAMLDMVRRSGLGVLAEPDDPDAVAAAITRIVCAPSPEALVTPNESFIAACDRSEAARQMAGYLRQAAAEGYRDRA
jgi:glycosyltransferase involved in cell wall biosynthesis